MPETDESPSVQYSRAAPSVSLRPRFPRSFSHTATVAGLERILAGDISLCIWRRPVNATIERYLSELVPARPMERLLRLDSAAPVLDPLLADLPTRSGRGEFLDDLLHLVDLFSTLCDSSRIGLRLTITREALCPRFHADGVNLRLLCTWQGRGTEWLEPESIDRTYLGSGSGGLSDESSGLILPGAQIYRMRCFEVGLFKGDAYPGNAGRGVVHRSPRPDDTGEWRVMATLDDID